MVEKSVGAVPHTGGKRFAPESDLNKDLVEWITNNCPNDPPTIPVCTSLEIYPRQAVLDGEGEAQQVTVIARYSDGTDRDVTSLALFMSNNDNSATISETCLVKAGKRGGYANLNLTPMVDMTFLLLIFFMITASFVTQKSLQTSPPEPSDDVGTVQMQVEDLQDQSVIVAIDAEGGMMVDDVPIESSNVLVETLMSKMASEQKTQLLIEANYNAKHGSIIQVIDAGLTAGMSNIRKTSRQDE